MCFLQAPLTKTPHVCFRVPNPKRHGRFKPRSELGRLEVGGGAGDGHPKLVGLGSGKPTPKNGGNMQLKYIYIYINNKLHGYRRAHTHVLDVFFWMLRMLMLDFKVT